jgi:phosphate-selective porin OprO and OprP
MTFPRQFLLLSILSPSVAWAQTPEVVESAELAPATAASGSTSGSPAAASAADGTPASPASDSSSPAAVDVVPSTGASASAAKAEEPQPAAPPSEAKSEEPKSEEPKAPSDPIVMKAQFGKGFTIGMPDETVTLNIRGRVQVQALASDADGEGGELTQVQVRRMRLVFQGNLLGKELQYYFQLAFSTRDQEPDVQLRSPLRDAYVTYAPLRDLNLRFGQMKIPYGRQRVTSSSALGMVDRSLVVTELNLDRDVGLNAFAKDFLGLDGRLGYALAVFGGDGRNRVADNAGLLYAARLNVSPFGGFEDNVEGGFHFDPTPKLAIGLGAAYNQATDRTQSTIGAIISDPTVAFDYGHLGADFIFKWHGFSATGEWMYRVATESTQDGVDEDGAPTTYGAREAWGAYGQLAQMLTKHLEVSARYGYLEPLVDTSPVRLTHELGGGLSYYFLEHNLKLQGDYFYISNQSDLSQGLHQGRVQAQVFF